MITVGVTTYNNVYTIPRVLNNILSQDVPDKYEILIVGGGSDGTEKLVEKFAVENDNIRYIKEKPRRGKPWAINKILREAKGDIIVLTDGDVFIGQGSLKKFHAIFGTTDIGSACGQVIPINDRNNLFGFWSHFLYNIAHKHRMEQARKDVLYQLTGYLSAIRKGIIERIPEDSLADDAMMGILVREKGYRIVYVPEARVFVRFPDTIRKFIRQKRRTFAGFYQIKQRYGVKDRTLFKEANEGLIDGLKYCRNLKETFSFFNLILFRAIAWLLAFYDLNIKRKDILDIWKEVKTY